MRAFYTSTNKCLELAQDNFSDESKQHKWFEDNLHIIFPNLKLVRRKMPISNKIPDTVVYDPQAHTFVAIEYKNRRSDTVRQQAENYLNKMDDNRAILTLAYNKSYNTHEDLDSFKWNDIYAIIVAPEFNKDQIYAASKKDNECLYELKKFENGVVTLRFIAGKRGPIDKTSKTAPTSEVSDATSANMGLHKSVVMGAVKPESVKVPPPAKPGEERPLTSFERVKKADCPKYLVRPDKRVPLKSWTNILVSVADYLITNKHIDKSHCPIKSGPKNAILNIKPVHQNGRQFKTNKEVHGLYLETWLSAAGSIRRSIKLINKAGVSLDDFKLSDSS